MILAPPLTARAAYVLRGNDTGALVTAAPQLYPHMWSWDAAFIAIGLAHLDVGRACAELDTLFAAQWRGGMLPHIVYSQQAADYFPGPDRWGAQELSAQAPRRVRTSGICQPPVHAIAVRRLLEIARGRGGLDRAVAEDFVWRAWPKLFAWHHWLAEHRDPGGEGLLAIVHGWESGMDNSPRWDPAYANVRPGPDLPPYTRRDLRLVEAGMRPSDAEYDRYLWLVEEMRRVGYHPGRVVRGSSFLVGDVFFTAIFALACEVLAELGEQIGQPATMVAQLAGWAHRSRAAVAATVDPATGLARDRDFRAGEWIATRTLAGFAPLLCGGLEPQAEQHLLSIVDGPDWCGHPDLAAAVLPSTAPSDPAFRPRQYWRGPQWPVMAWLFSWAFARRGWAEQAEKQRAEGIRLCADGTFAEYYHPLTGQPLGSLDQSWTAAVVLDWLC
ncbi:glycogen debranching protein [Crossiella sp. CA-258035]|uniref:glucosylglycerate hydrolase n=1 Tax=Crossiella sp. CA-258035 TaxID=2981138 RepID=UPI0024BCF5DA|nr:glycogen debranching protein [Crossiella sp. CA-258035]WHT23129.1 glycogen debranching protein [Crossiella sp. CA-258035]